MGGDRAGQLGKQNSVILTLFVTLFGFLEQRGVLMIWYILCAHPLPLPRRAHLSSLSLLEKALRSHGTVPRLHACPPVCPMSDSTLFPLPRRPRAA
jgi:hypothetical protein